MAETFTVTNESKGVRVIYDAQSQPVTFMPEQTKDVSLVDELAKKLRSGKSGLKIVASAPKKVPEVTEEAPKKAADEAAPTKRAAAR